VGDPHLELVGRFPGTALWVLGDAMLDEYVEGDVERVSPEAPVPIVRGRRIWARPGGAANVAAGLAAMGARVELCTVTGTDGEADRLLALCREAGIGTRAVRRLADRPTTRKVRVLARSRQVLRVDWERTDPVDPEAARLAWAGLAGGPLPQALVVSDYAKGLVTPRLLDEVLACCRAAGVPVVVDPKHPDFGRYRGATVITPNHRELEAAAGAALQEEDTEGIVAAARALLARWAFGHVAVTRGPRGLTLVGRSDARTFPAGAREVSDVTGAGDTVVALLALGLAARGDLAVAAVLATAAAGLTVSRVGTAPVALAELRQALGPVRPPPAAPRGKVLSPSELDRRLAGWRADGRRVVFTNGVFDLLHPGHLRLLEEAARLGDVLLVAVNSDRSVTRLKGVGRPILSQDDRAACLAALACVDGVVVFDEDTPLALLERVRPDVLVKGGDYRIDQVVGQDLVRELGGEVVLVPLVPGHSTTRLVERARTTRGEPLAGR
jgi:D-beta-D-heptose 7-phosphate kinase/D-beta-D-heptose 1-phosphate adenosyltransferase